MTTPMSNDSSHPPRRPLTTGARWLGLVFWIAVCFVAAAVGSQFLPGQWYDDLKKPSWTPPNWVFGPVWTVLYLMMAIAAWLVWCVSGWKNARGALIAFVIQLSLNAAWSWAFFGLHQPMLAMINIVVLWFAIATTIALFAKHRPVAAALLVPYILWVTYASTLNAGIWYLNST
ncbi:MAG: tryptophan-rich sensory protein [Pirellulaceae bacterium]|nr:tryptophan-rich sensory protein [Pirellulaceae bacterium]